MDSTENLNLPYLMPSQAQKHVTHNEALRALDALIQLAAISRTVEIPPVSPQPGDRYIVPVDATGAWSGHGGAIAAWQDGGWTFHAPRDGWLAYALDENALLFRNSSGWSDYAANLDELQNMARLGVNATADAGNRLALSSAASLFTHEGAGHQIKINKADAGDTASVLFQTGFSGRAEFGLAGDDDFHVKVSADGAAFTEALVIERATGKATFPSGVTGLRESLTANRTFYVATTGSNANNGLTAGTAFATLQKAVDEAGKLDCSIYNVVIQLADGNYAGATLSRPLLGGGTLSILGNETTPANVVLNSGTLVDNGAHLSITGVKFDFPADWMHALQIGIGAQLSIGAVEFGTVGANADHINSESPCRITIEQDYVITGGGRRHVGLSGPAVLTGTNRTFMLAGTPAFTQFLCAINCATISLWNLSLSGSATGSRYLASTNGVINLFGKGADFLPGDAAGTVASGGVYA
ncbi:DUF2793 domain-containing protein [Mesorhizobium sp. A623]